MLNAEELDESLLTLESYRLVNVDIVAECSSKNLGILITGDDNDEDEGPCRGGVLGGSVDAMAICALFLV